MVRKIVPAGVFLFFLAACPAQAREDLNKQLIQALSDGLDLQMSDVERVMSLLDAGADPDAVGEGGDTALMAAARNGDFQTVKLLVERGAEIDRRGNHSRTALACAVQEGHAQVVRFLLDAGADPRMNDSTGTPLLHYAVMGGYRDGRFQSYTEIAGMLLEKGVPVDGKDYAGNTPLMVASSLGHADAIVLLLDHGADIEAQTPQENCAGPEPVGKGLVADSLEGVVLKRMPAVDSSQDLDVSDRAIAIRPPCMTSLMMAASAGRRDAVRILLDRGANPNTLSHRTGMTALMHAARTGDPKIVKMLLDRGADFKIKDANGRTALAWAEEMENTKAAMLIRSAGAAES
ncbi:MAG: ankyrin repeat domain-containing protein [Candidatus Omnitrophica bacterium]|nr:ankyrin repeat domain-containing protein [Candidatus Omnitrophota bacterium]